MYIHPKKRERGNCVDSFHPCHRTSPSRSSFLLHPRTRSVSQGLGSISQQQQKQQLTFHSDHKNTNKSPHSLAPVCCSYTRLHTKKTKIHSYTHTYVHTYIVIHSYLQTYTRAFLQEARKCRHKHHTCRYLPYSSVVMSKRDADGSSSFEEEKRV